jgi:hypothetical protein
MSSRAKGGEGSAEKRLKWSAGLAERTVSGAKSTNSFAKAFAKN